jgi:hypothetical protein
MGALSDFVSDLEDMPVGGSIVYWLSRPKPGKHDEDDPWHEFELLNESWVKIQERREWYESPNVPGIYKEHKYIFNANMGMGTPYEREFEQNIDDNSFATEFYVSEDLPSGIGSGTLRITSEISTQYPPSDDNGFCLVEYLVSTEIKYSIAKGITWLPRILARPLNRLFRFVFYLAIVSDMVERDGEYARERTAEYFQYLRQYHGEEPTQEKTRRADFNPLPEEGVFFR